MTIPKPPPDSDTVITPVTLIGAGRDASLSRCRSGVGVFLGATAPGRELADFSFDEDCAGSERPAGGGAFFGKMSKVRPPPEEPPELDAEP